MQTCTLLLICFGDKVASWKERLEQNINTTVVIIPGVDYAGGKEQINLMCRENKQQSCKYRAVVSEATNVARTTYSTSVLPVLSCTTHLEGVINYYIELVRVYQRYKHYKSRGVTTQLSTQGLACCFPGYWMDRIQFHRASWLSYYLRWTYLVSRVY